MKHHPSPTQVRLCAPFRIQQIAPGDVHKLQIQARVNGYAKEALGLGEDVAVRDALVARVDYDAQARQLRRAARKGLSKARDGAPQNALAAAAGVAVRVEKGDRALVRRAAAKVARPEDKHCDERKRSQRKTRPRAGADEEKQPVHGDVGGGV